MKTIGILFGSIGVFILSFIFVEVIIFPHLTKILGRGENPEAPECQDVLVYYSNPADDEIKISEILFINHYSKMSGNQISLEDAVKIVKAVNKYNDTALDNIVLLTMISLESHFKRDAFNPVTKDYGIAQINQRTYEGIHEGICNECDVESLFDIDYNIKIMCKVLKNKEQGIIKVLKLNTKDPKDKMILFKALVSSYNSGVTGYMKNYHDIEDSRYYNVIVRRLNNWEKILRSKE